MGFLINDGAILSRFCCKVVTIKLNKYVQKFDKKCSIFIVHGVAYRVARTNKSDD
jgi:hypothetical protein